MRITTGKYRGREILAPQGKTTRPVLTRVRQAIFNTIAPYLEDATVLDPFCGSGGFAIEALSRGARAAVCVDLSAEAVAAVRANLERLRVTEEVEVYRNDAQKAIAKLASLGRRFEVIVVAPPYFKGLEAPVLGAVDETSLLAPDGILFVQRDRKDRKADPPEGLARLRLESTRDYGNTLVDYYIPAETAADAGATSRAPAS
jgi:16S rRNA (guanine(966)-N(2))-methyltransferase RsmD